MNEQKKSIFSPNKIVAIIIYALIIFLIAGFITIFLAVVLGVFNDLDITMVMECISSEDMSLFEAPYVKVNALAQGWGNLLGYLLAFIGVVFFMRDDVVTDFKELGKRKGFHAIYILLCAIAFLVITMIVEVIVAQFVPDSTNQSVIEAILNNGGAFPMILATVLFAPIVEELVYRKAIFSLCNKYGVAACYLFSIIFFTLPHMLSSDMSNMGVWLLQCIPYAVSGGLLCLIYHKSNYNVYTVIAVHMINNLLACILAFM